MGIIMPATTVAIKVIKRDNRTEDFKPYKIISAVTRCFRSVSQLDISEIGKIAGDIAKRVQNIVSQRTTGEVGVEDIQRLVIQQLWACEHFEAGEHYTIYREEHRKARQIKPIDPNLAKSIQDDAAHFPEQIQYLQLVSKFSRWREHDNRRETWNEATDRTIDFFRRQEQIRLSPEEFQMLRDGMYDHQASPAMRVLQMAGPGLDRCHVAAYNCSYLPIKDILAYPEMLYILMQGTGAGFSVENQYIEELPRVKRQNGGAVEMHKVEDSTDGWCDAYKLGLERWWNGYDIKYDYSGVRPAGARLKTKGGRATGPEALRNLLDFARTKILSRQGKFLTDLDCHDLGCMTGRIVQVSGVRRSSEISLSDLDSLDMRHAKTGNFWDVAPWRNMANNSSVYTERPSSTKFMEEWLALAKSGTGERGIFNRDAVCRSLPARRKVAEFGTNPCGEIILRPYQFCNLSIAVARPGDTVADLVRKVTLATYFGTMQATLTKFNYLRDDWKRNCEEERLLGVDITGQMDCEILRPFRGSMADRDAMLRMLKGVVSKKNIELSQRFGINPSTANTCVKPSGNSGQFFNCSSGVHLRWSDYYIRNVRLNMIDPVSQLLRDEGVPWEVDLRDNTLCVFSFPIKSPDGAPTRHDLTALQQLENWLSWKQNFAEHSVSCTIYVREDEWFSTGNWVYEHIDDISGLSFSPFNGGVYPQTPYIEISKQQYETMIANFPTINWAKLQRYESEDNTSMQQEYACVGGACEWNS